MKLVSMKLVSMKLVTLKVLLLAVILLALPCWAGRSFNGSTDHTTVSGVGNAIDLTGSAGTWSCWFNLPSLPASGNSYSCMGKTTATWSGGYAFFIQSTGVISFFFYINISLNHSHTVACSTTVTTGHWHNAVAVYQNNVDARIYLDGTQCGIDSGVGTTGSLVTSGLSLLLGGQLQSWAPCCTNLGSLGEIAIWNVRLSPGQIQALANVCPAGASARRMGFPPPVGYWPMTGASGSSIEPDFSGNVLNATLSGTAAANHPPCTP